MKIEDNEGINMISINTEDRENSQLDITVAQVNAQGNQPEQNFEDNSNNENQLNESQLGEYWIPCSLSYH